VWNPAERADSLDTVASNVFLENVRKVPEEHVDEMDRAASGKHFHFNLLFWLIRRWLDTSDEVLALRPVIPEEPAVSHLAY
jgi:hypothetical protein